MRPYGGWFDDVVDALIEDLQEAGIDPAAAIEKGVIEHDELTLFIAREHLLDVVRPLRDDQDLRFELCLGVNGVHYPDDAGRELHACFALMSLTHGGRQLRLEVACPATDPHVPSIVSVYPGDDWHERDPDFNAYDGDLEFTIPDDDYEAGWHEVVNTATGKYDNGGEIIPAGTTMTVPSRSMIVLREAKHR